jgi:hypothetical protein
LGPTADQSPPPRPKSPERPPKKFTDSAHIDWGEFSEQLPSDAPPPGGRTGKHSESRVDDNAEGWPEAGDEVYARSDDATYLFGGPAAAPRRGEDATADDDDDPDIGETTRIERAVPVRDFSQVTLRSEGEWSSVSSMTLEKGGRSRILVGRHPGADWSCPNDMVMSERHFEVRIEGDLCLVQDLESTNGTFINGQGVHLAPVTHGDRIEAGQSIFTVEFSGGRDSSME